MAIPKVLVCSVGGSPQPIVNAVKQNNPSFTYFLCSSGHAGSDRTVEEVTYQPRMGRCPYCEKTFEVQERVEPIASITGLSPDQYRIFGIKNQDDLKEIIQTCQAISQDIAERFAGTEPSVVANYTGGTKTMTLGLGIYALRSDWDIQLQAGQRTDLIRVKQGDVALLQDVSAVQIDDLLRSAREAANSLQFADAVSILTFALSRMKLPFSEQATVREWRAFYRLWEARDRFDYSEALSILENEALPPDVDQGELRATLRALKGAAQRLEAGERPVRGDRTVWVLVEDLILNVERCTRRRRYDDAIARLYRATELLAQIQLLRNFGIKTGDIDIASTEKTEGMMDWMRERASVAPDSQRKVRIGLFDSYDLLSRLGDPLGEFWRDSASELKYWVEKRNTSYLAHGFTVIDEDSWGVVGQRWLSWLQEAQTVARRG